MGNIFKKSALVLVQLILVGQCVAVECSIVEKTVMLQSAVLNEERTVDIVLPESYCDNPNATYPVLYLLDGNYNKGWAIGMLDIMTGKSHYLPEMILVSIRDKGTKAYREYMTPSIENNGVSSQKDPAFKFTQFIANELKPYINQRFATAELSILYGHSMGGLFALNTLVTASEEFDIVIASSPSVWNHDYKYAGYLVGKLKEHKAGAAELYLSLGDETRMGVLGLVDLLERTPSANVDWSFRRFNNENHGSVAPVAMKHALINAFQGWFVPENLLSGDIPAADLFAKYKGMLAKWGVKQPIPEASIRGMLRYYYARNEQDKVTQFIESAIAEQAVSELALLKAQSSYVGHYETPERALAILQQAEMNYANSTDYLLALGSVYESTGNQADANLAYKKALVIAQQQGAEQWLLTILKENIALTSQ